MLCCQRGYQSTGAPAVKTLLPYHASSHNTMGAHEAWCVGSSRHFWPMQIWGSCVASANTPLALLERGLEQWLGLGVPAAKLLLGLPW